MSLLTDFSGSGSSGGYAISEWGEYDTDKFMEVESSTIVKPTWVGEWTAKAPMPTAASGVSAIAISADDYLVLILGTMYRYTPSTDTFTEDTNYTLTHHSFAHMALYNDGTNDFVFIFGGKDVNGTALDAYSVFDVTNGTYTDKGVMAIGTLVNSSVASYTASDSSKHIYIYSGYINGVVSGELLDYDPVNDVFNAISGTFEGRYKHHIEVFNGVLYIFAGYDEFDNPTNILKRFDLTTLVYLPDVIGGVNGATLGGVSGNGNFKVLGEDGFFYTYVDYDLKFYRQSTAFYTLDVENNTYYYDTRPYAKFVGFYGVGAYVFGGGVMFDTDEILSFSNSIPYINKETKVLISKV